MKFVLFALMSLLFVQCEDEPIEDMIVSGLSPRYTTLMLGQNVSVEAMEFDELSNFIVFGDYLLLVERSKGIHIVNNVDPANPINIVFIEMPGTIGAVAIDDNMIISLANYLITVDISDFTDATIVNILEIENSNQGEGLYPLDYNGYFECVDPDRGIVYEWVREDLINPKCKTVQ